ncbi:tetratricopeptide repeat protein [Amphibacillus sp. Q70]|uniref:tetratricopeptide repeat protein n=1 Tax=Amphibacillus sp. Q70 TaxID=3453416 RepID=UPI003F874E7E
MILSNDYAMIFIYGLKRCILGGLVINIADFSETLLSVNDVIYFDKSEYLREKTSNSLKLNQVIHQAEDLLKSSHENDKYFLYGALGNLYRINGQPKKAINCLTYCLNQAVEEKKPRGEIVSLIRLGEALKYGGNHKKALDHFNKALGMCETLQIDEYLDFGLQHKGKCLMELAMLDEAEQCFQKALELRKAKKSHSLINSTEQAIELVRAMQG